MVDVWLVYIREAHAVDSQWPMASVDGSVLEDPRTLEERVANTRHCTASLDFGGIPTVVDTIDDSAERAYAAWPDRLVLLDAEGRVAWRSEPGPFGFDPDGFAKAIERELARTAPPAVVEPAPAPTGAPR
jgi:type I thyroxine 5'-deiodinase